MSGVNIFQQDFFFPLKNSYGLSGSDIFGYLALIDLFHIKGYHMNSQIFLSIFPGCMHHSLN